MVPLPNPSIMTFVFTGYTFSANQPICKHSQKNTKIVNRSCYITHVTYKEIRNGYIRSDTSIIIEMKYCMWKKVVQWYSVDLSYQRSQV